MLDFGAVCLGLGSPDVIFHLASKADVRKSFDSASEVFGNNVLGTINLFEAVRGSGADPLVVLCSSSEVYGNPEAYPIAEGWPMRPLNPYAVSKASQDLLGQMYGRCYGMRVVITRAFGYVNPRRRDLALSNFARQIVEIERGERDVLLHGNLDAVRTFCDVRDVVRAYALAVEPGIYNIGSDEPVTVRECLEMLMDLSDKPIRTKEDASLMRPSDVTNQIPDCRRFKELTGWEPEISLEESLGWLLETYRAA